MKLEYKNTEVDIVVNETNSQIGLGDNDKWCKVDFKIKNEEVNYNNSREVITQKELKEAVKELKTFYQNSLLIEKKISFIKNYFKVSMYRKNNIKHVEFDLYEAKKEQNKFEAYQIYFVKEEIQKLIIILEEQIKNMKD